ncbi:HNH endonuclease family protein [Pseudodonghicola flavimaris]|uniref:HNH endonuclease n=1 Tax=Pseudodonghicola flavimaris TaxID=3050036 RepID=A0ABT7EZB3_9RHOB|nr:HNH endonuclease [Pseudodonghicola flavimaris]MDK3017674.1 HNH endonuclease [Pseudodonghicola flavimaris]
MPDPRPDARSFSPAAHDAATGDPICPLCGRPIPADVAQSRHHLIPRLRGGKGGPTVLLHDICHREIHATLTESQLARNYHTIAALQAHPHLASFIDWVRKRPPGFRSRVPGPRRRR